MMDAGQALTRAADLLESSGWCQNETAVDARGKSVDARSGNAVAWCMWGALDHVALRPGDEPQEGRLRVVSEALIRVRDVIGWNRITAWNDTPGRTVVEVVDALRRAAE